MSIPKNLFCLPFAGGSEAVFGPWRQHALPGLQVRPLTLPGRGSRWREGLLCEWTPLLDQLLDQLAPHRETPYLLFGHSMGALLVFELAHRLREAQMPAPERLVLSASRPPHLRHRLADTDWLTCSTAQLLDEVQAISGPSEALANEELRELMLPILRNDFQLCARYPYQPRPPLDVPILVLAGRDDSGCPLAPALSAWRQQTLGEVQGVELPGGHLFMRDDPGAVLAVISQHSFKESADVDRH